MIIKRLIKCYRYRVADSLFALRFFGLIHRLINFLRLINIFAKKQTSNSSLFVSWYRAALAIIAKIGKNIKE